MRKPIFCLFFLLVFLILSPGIKSQTKLTAGPVAGVGWYNGDLNNSRQFYQMHPAFGLLFRYAIKDRIAFRAQASIMELSGDYQYQDYYFPNSAGSSYHFERSIGDVVGLMEINMFSFDHPFSNDASFTPFLTFGLGTTIYKRYEEENGKGTEKPTFVLSLPFGAGVKWKVNPWVQVGADWIFRRTFVDDLDVMGFNNSIDPADPYHYNISSSIHNNDWYSMVGVYVTFRVFSTGDKCFDGF